MRRWRCGSPRQLEEHPQPGLLHSGPMPARGLALFLRPSPPGSGRERARVRGQIATEMFSSPQGKKNLYKISTSYPTTHIQHLGDSRVLLFSRILLVVTAALLLWLVLVYSWRPKPRSTQDQCKVPQTVPPLTAGALTLSAPGKPGAASRQGHGGVGRVAASLSWPRARFMSMLHSATLHHPLGPPHPPAFTIIM